jgi:hypothetical protein
MALPFFVSYFNITTIKEIITETMEIAGKDRIKVCEFFLFFCKNILENNI